MTYAPGVASLAALAVSGIALGGVVALLAVTAAGSKAHRERDNDTDDDDSDDGRRRRWKQGVAEDEAAGMTTGFSMEEARESADADHEKAKSKRPSEVLSELQKGNARFWMGTARRPECSAFERRALISKQFPLTAILGCSDSRVPTEIVFDQGLGDMFVVRVAGNCLDNTTAASLQYSVYHLKVKVLVVLGHEGCGAIKAAQLPGDAIDKEPACLGKLLNTLKAGLDEDRLQALRDAKAHDREAVTTNVKRQVEKLTTDTGIMMKVKSGELIIVGAFYEISSGIVDFFHEVNQDTAKEMDSSLDVGICRGPSRGVLTRLDKDTKL